MQTRVGCLIKNYFYLAVIDVRVNDQYATCNIAHSRRK
jgi:hypothetical protein